MVAITGGGPSALLAGGVGVVAAEPEPGAGSTEDRIAAALLVCMGR
jgi:hypothetical protein